MIIKPSLIMPSLMILLSVGSAIFYGFDGDWRRMVYWSAASCLTASVTY